MKKGRKMAVFSRNRTKNYNKMQQLKTKQARATRQERDYRYPILHKKVIFFTF